jgi:hypothetical protein
MVSFLYALSFPPVFLKLLLVLKEIMVVLMALLLIAKGKVAVQQLSVLLLLVFCLPYLLITNMPFEQSIGGLRTYVLFTFAFFVGFELARTPDAFRYFVNKITPLFWLIILFSFLEYFLLPASIWKEIFPIMEMKRVVGGIIVTNEYYQTGMPVNAFGELVRRLLGPFNEPLYTAYFMIILVNFLLAGLLSKLHVRKFALVSGVVSIFLTQTRAIVIGLLLSALAFVFKTRRLNMKLVYAGFLFVAMAVISVFAFWDFYSAFVESIFSKAGRNVGHIDAYVEGTKLMLAHPLGLGLGASSTLFSGISSNASTENAFINIALEIGIIGVLLYGGLLFFSVIKFHQYLVRYNNHSGKEDYAVVTVSYLLTVQFIFAGLVAPHILTARIVIPFMLVVGWGYGVVRKNRQLTRTCGQKL